MRTTSAACFALVSCLFAQDAVAQSEPATPACVLETVWTDDTKTAQITVVASKSDGYLFMLPVASDWAWECPAGQGFRAMSKAEGYAVSLNPVPADKPLDAKVWLHDIQANLTANMKAKAGVDVVDATVSAEDGTHVLTYRLAGRPELDDAPGQAWNLWTSAQRPDGLVFDLHITWDFLATKVPKKTIKRELSALRSLMAGTLKVGPPSP